MLERGNSCYYIVKPLLSWFIVVMCSYLNKANINSFMLHCKGYITIVSKRCVQTVAVVQKVAKPAISSYFLT